MRRIVTWILSTVTVLVLLFSYHTSTSSATAPPEQVAAGGATSGRAPVDAPGPATSNGSGSPAEAAPDDNGSVAAPGSGSGSATSGSAASGSAASGSTGSAQTGGSTVAGNAVDTRFGPVQVQITVAGGKITASDVLQVPMRDRRDQMINSSAVPILNREAVSAQNAKIDTVSGATYTSDGYAQSLQSAIDKAHL